MNGLNIKTMQADMLMSIINMKLRAEDYDLDRVCRQLDLNPSHLEKRLARHGYGFLADLGQFRAL